MEDKDFYPLSYSQQDFDGIMRIIGLAGTERRFSMADALWGGGGIDDIKDKKITAIYLSDDQHILRFTTLDGNIDYFMVGDCCSESWVYAITGVMYLLNATVTAVEGVFSIDLPDDGKSRQELDKLYWLKITTNLGMADIEFRNSSYGFYGGYIIRVDSIPDNARLMSITADYVV